MSSKRCGVLQAVPWCEDVFFFFSLYTILTISFPRSYASFLNFPWRCHTGIHPRLPLLPPGLVGSGVGPGPHLVYSPAPRIVRAARGCRASIRGSSGQLQRPRRGLHRCPRPRPARGAHCPAAGHRRVRSRELPPGWSLRPHLGPSAGRIRSKWRLNLQTPETTGGERGDIGGQRQAPRAGGSQWRNCRMHLSLLFNIH